MATWFTDSLDHDTPIYPIFIVSGHGLPFYFGLPSFLVLDWESPWLGGFSSGWWNGPCGSIRVHRIIFATYIGLSPLPGIVTARMFTFWVEARTKSSFAIISVKGNNPTYNLHFGSYCNWTALKFGWQGGSPVAVAPKRWSHSQIIILCSIKLAQISLMVSKVLSD